MFSEITPVAPSVQRPSARPSAPIRAETFEGSLRSLVSRTEDTARGRGVRRAITSLARLAVDRGRGGELLAEISVGYVATGAEIGKHSARAGLGLVLDVIGRIKIGVQTARKQGFELRELSNGGRRGPLWLFCREAIDAIGAVRDWLVASGLGVGTSPTQWQQLQPDTLEARGYRHCSVVRGDFAICPHHADSDPSLRLFGTGLSGAGFCHGCGSSMHWTTSADGAIWTRPTDSGSSLLFDRGPTPRTESRFRGLKTRVLDKPPAVIGGVSPVGDLSGERWSELAGVSAGYVSGSRSSRGMRRNWARPVLESLVWADRCGPVAERAAYVASGHVLKGADPIGVLPDRFLSVSPLRAERVDLRPVPGDGDDARRAIAVPSVLKPHSQEWVLVDIDDLEGWADWQDQACAEIAALVGRDSRLSGRCAVVETSSTGVQVWAELAEVQDDPRRWWVRDDVISWYAEFSARVLIILREAGRDSGHVDISAAAPGRFGRRPGWRLEDGWIPYRAKIIGIVEDPAIGLESSRSVRRRWRVSQSRRS